MLLGANLGGEAGVAVASMSSGLLQQVGGLRVDLLIAGCQGGELAGQSGHVADSWAGALDICLTTFAAFARS
jgi:hypothetical protein